MSPGCFPIYFFIIFIHQSKTVTAQSRDTEKTKPRQKNLTEFIQLPLCKQISCTNNSNRQTDKKPFTPEQGQKLTCQEVYMFNNRAPGTIRVHRCNCTRYEASQAASLRPFPWEHLEKLGGSVAFQSLTINLFATKVQNLIVSCIERGSWEKARQKLHPVPAAHRKHYST